jgi:hypothetical protein
MVDTGRWTIGPKFEVRLFGPLSFEIDALFRGYREQSGYASTLAAGVNVVQVGLFTSSQVNSKEWDIPLLLKYRFRVAKTHLFADAGWDVAHVSSDVTASQTCLGSDSACIAAGLNAYVYPSSPFHFSQRRNGPAAGAGVEFKYHKLTIAPEVRYTKLTQPNVNGVTLLVGFTF